MTTNARFVKNVNDRQKLWQLPDGSFVLTSFTHKTNPPETMAFEAWEGGGVKDWLEIDCIIDFSPKHEELIERILLRGTKL
jgi:hypothetical protein